MIKIEIGLLLVLISLSSALKAGDDVDLSGRELNAVRTTVPFLTIAPDARSAGMGDVGVASTPDLSSQHWNSAKYLFMKQKAGGQISFTPWLKNLGVNDLYLAYASGYFKVDDRQTISAGLRYFSLGSIQLTNNSGDEAGTSNPSEFAFDLGYGMKLSNNFGAGLLLRYIRSDIAGGVGAVDSPDGMEYNPGNSVAADLSGYYEKTFEISGMDVESAFGINISNIGFKMAYSESDDKEFIPTNLRLGGRGTLQIDEYNKLSLMVDLNKLLVPTPPITSGDTIKAGKDDDVGTFAGMIQSFYDAPAGGKEEFHEIMYSVGAEYWYREQFALRAGYFSEHATKGNRKYFTVGVGLKLNVFSVDFSYLVPAVNGRNNPLDKTYRVSLGFVFE